MTNVPPFRKSEKNNLPVPFLSVVCGSHTPPERCKQQAMGQKREQTIEVEFTEADKECLVRLVKELVAKGAQGDKVRRGISPSQKDGSPRQQLRHPISEPRRATSRHGSRRRRRER